MHPPDPGRAVEVEVRFTLTTPEWTPIPGAAVRIVIGDGADWRDPAAGTRFTTGLAGEHLFTASTVIGSRRRKMPTNFWSSLVARPRATDHLRVATELEYAGCRWLYLSAVDRFRNGSCAQLDGFSVLGQDPTGRFTVAAGRRGGVWVLPGVPGPGLSSPGHSVSELALERDPLEPDRWTLRLGYWRMPAPVVRG